MALIQVEHLSFSYDSTCVFNDVSFRMDTCWKLGFIGRNGCGKTTFLKLLLGEYEYSGMISSHVAFSYFPYTVEKEEDKVLQLAQQLCPNTYEWQLIREFNLLHLADDILYRPFVSLSLGEKTKVLLAFLLLRKDQFLLIDEPTNHLDLEGRKIVAHYLKNKQGFIVVSHDRDFLDQIIDHVLSINKCNIEIQQGTFTSWYLNKKRQDEYEWSEDLKLKKEIKRLEAASRQKADWSLQGEKSKFGTGEKVDRGYIGHKAAKMMKLSKNIEHRQNRLIEEKRALLQNIDFGEELKLFPLRFHNDVLVQLQNVGICYDGVWIIRNFTMSIRQGERIYLYGKNGTGKSSILKLIVGKPLTFEGELFKSSNLKISYVCQDIKSLTGSLDDYIARYSIDATLFKTILYKFGFSREEFSNLIDFYSDGMKKKVELARSLCERAHLYVWDEPLNYIDVVSRMQLESLIKKFQPTIIFVEHDQKFCEQIATQVMRIGPFI